jgi:hypothetical protein
MRGAGVVYDKQSGTCGHVRSLGCGKNADAMRGAGWCFAVGCLDFLDTDLWLDAARQRACPRKKARKNRRDHEIGNASTTDSVAISRRDCWTLFDKSLFGLNKTSSPPGDQNEGGNAAE